MRDRSSGTVSFCAALRWRSSALSTVASSTHWEIAASVVVRALLPRVPCLAARVVLATLVLVRVLVHSLHHARNAVVALGNGANLSDNGCGSRYRGGRFGRRAGVFFRRLEPRRRDRAQRDRPRRSQMCVGASGSTMKMTMRTRTTLQKARTILRHSPPRPRPRPRPRQTMHDPVWTARAPCACVSNFCA